MDRENRMNYDERCIYNKSSRSLSRDFCWQGSVESVGILGGAIKRSMLHKSKNT